MNTFAHQERSDVKGLSKRHSSWTSSSPRLRDFAGLAAGVDSVDELPSPASTLDILEDWPHCGAKGQVILEWGCCE